MEHDYQSYFVFILMIATILLLIVNTPGVQVEKSVCDCTFNASNRWDARNIPDRAPENINWTPLYKEV